MTERHLYGADIRTTLRVFFSPNLCVTLRFWTYHRRQQCRSSSSSSSDGVWFDLILNAEFHLVTIPSGNSLATKSVRFSGTGWFYDIFLPRRGHDIYVIAHVEVFVRTWCDRNIAFILFPYTLGTDGREAIRFNMKCIACNVILFHPLSQTDDENASTWNLRARSPSGDNHYDSVSNSRKMLIVIVPHEVLRSICATAARVGLSGARVRISPMHLSRRRADV